VGEQITFGPFCLDVGANLLTRDGAPVDLRPQAVHALHALLQHTGRYLDYPEMIRAAWHGNVVSRHTVAVTVGEVKKALGEHGHWIGYRPKLGYRLDVPQSDELIRRGWHFWNRQSREGLEKALCCFERAAACDAADFRAHEGIASSYLKLGTYSMRPPREMYARFLEAHQRAVGLGGLTPELRSDRALGLQVFERRFADAEAELVEARRERPRTAKINATLAMLYVSMGRFEEGLALTSHAQDAHELWPVFPAAQVLLRICLRQFDTAVALGREAVDLHPFLHLGRAFFAQALEYSGQIEEALEQYRFAWTIYPGPTWIRALEAKCLAELHRFDEAWQILHWLQQTRESEYVDAYHMALLLDSLGERDEAIGELNRAVDENSALLCLMDVDPKFDSLRSDQRLRALRKRVFENAASTPQAQVITAENGVRPRPSVLSK
jgi:DNA-binding winged helix-turn-helix (wHTH) protein/thioredoxin-like negative regulator of GroEL